MAKPYQGRRLVRPNLQHRAPFGKARAALVVLGAPLAQVVQALPKGSPRSAAALPQRDGHAQEHAQALSMLAWVVVSPSVPGRSTTPLSTLMPAPQQGQP